jgi:hypothetical protein
MELSTMEPNPVWSAGAYEETVDTLAEWGQVVTFRVWGDDGCKDCRSQLPDFAAALAAADVPDEHVVQYEVERLPDGGKRGPQVEEYGIERIPTVVVERGGEEIARFVEAEPVPIAVFLAEQLGSLESPA